MKRAYIRNSYLSRQQVCSGVLGEMVRKDVYAYLDLSGTVSGLSADSDTQRSHDPFVVQEKNKCN